MSIAPHKMLAALLLVSLISCISQSEVSPLAVASFDQGHVLYLEVEGTIRTEAASLKPQGWQHWRDELLQTSREVALYKILSGTPTSMLPLATSKPAAVPAVQAWRKTLQRRLKAYTLIELQKNPESVQTYFEANQEQLGPLVTTAEKARPEGDQQVLSSVDWHALVATQQEQVIERYFSAFSRSLLEKSAAKILEEHNFRFHESDLERFFLP